MAAAAPPPRRNLPAPTSAAPRPPPSTVASGPRPSAPAAGAAEVSPVTVAPSLSAPPVITNPRFRRPPAPPQYPQRAVDLGQSGVVIIRALVTPDGDTRETRVWRSSGYALLDAAAIAAVRRWAFEPATRDNRGIEAWVEVPVDFRLR